MFPETICFRQNSKTGRNLKKLSLQITDTVIILRLLFINNEYCYYITRGVIMIRINLSTILGKKRITQAELSRKTGIRPATINEMYHEITERVNLIYLDKICEALNCDISDLLEYVPNTVKTTGKNLIVESHGNQKRHKKV